MITLFGRRIDSATGKPTGAVRSLLSDYAECIEKHVGDVLSLWEGDFIVTSIRFTK